MSIDLVPLWVAEWTESDKHIKLIGLKTITMKKNNYDQAKRKTWTESVKGRIKTYFLDFIIQINTYPLALWPGDVFFFFKAPPPPPTYRHTCYWVYVSGLKLSQMMFNQTVSLLFSETYP